MKRKSISRFLERMCLDVSRFVFCMIDGFKVLEILRLGRKWKMFFSFIEVFFWVLFFYCCFG